MSSFFLLSESMWDVMVYKTAANTVVKIFLDFSIGSATDHKCHDHVSSILK